MGLHITGDAMFSESTPHTARELESGAWEVSWLPGRSLDRNSAVTAMTIAEAAAEPAGGVDRSGLIRALAQELDLSRDEALGLVSTTPPAVEDVDRDAELEGILDRRPMPALDSAASADEDAPADGWDR